MGRMPMQIMLTIRKQAKMLHLIVNHQMLDIHSKFDFMKFLLCDFIWFGLKIV